MDEKTHYELREAIMHMMRKGYDSEFIPKGKYTTHLKIAYGHQKRLGLWNIRLGIFVKKWGDIAEQTYRDRKCHKAMTGTRWIRNIVKFLFQNFEVNWKVRNIMFHGKGEEYYEKERLLEKIRKITDMRILCSKEIEKLVKKGKKYLTEKNTHMKTLRQWVLVMEDLLEYTTGNNLNESEDIRKFFRNEPKEGKSSRNEEKDDDTIGTCQEKTEDLERRLSRNERPNNKLG